MDDETRVELEAIRDRLNALLNPEPPMTLDSGDNGPRPGSN